MNDPYSIKIHVVTGDPEGFRIIDQMNWTGQGLVFPRTEWPAVRSHEGFGRPGVYVLVGYETDEDELFTVYIGEGDGIRDRLESHFRNKDFWSWAVAFVSTNNTLNKAHIQWLEFALIERARRINRCKIGNTNTPQEPVLSPADRSDTSSFFKEVLQILPLVGLRVFDELKAVIPATVSIVPAAANTDVFDTVVVPAIQDGFERVFLGENRWHAVRLGAGSISNIKHIAVYRSAPVSAITHIADVARIEPYGESGKYQLIFNGPAQEIRHVAYDQVPGNQIQGIRYTRRAKLLAAQTISDLLPWG